MPRASWTRSNGPWNYDAALTRALAANEAAIPEAERGDLISAFHRRLTSESPVERQEAARIWSVWEASTSHLLQDRDYIQSAAGDEFSLAFARIEADGGNAAALDNWSQAVARFTGNDVAAPVTDGMAWLGQIVMFTLLGLLAWPQTLGDRVFPALFVAVVLTFLARPAAVALCRRLQEQGITTVVATPHWHSPRFQVEGDGIATAGPTKLSGGTWGKGWTHFAPGATQWRLVGDAAGTSPRVVVLAVVDHDR